MQTKRRTRLIWKPYFSPTPKRVRVFGDALAGASLWVAGLNIDHPKLMMWCGIIGGLAKFVSNFIGIEDVTE